jgi:hypothetical protein
MGAAGELTEPTIAFRVQERDEPGLEIRVNFGMFAGRHATQAEIDDLARSLNDVVESFTVVAEEVHELGGSVEAARRPIAIRIATEDAGDDAELLGERVVARAEAWASDCIRSRSNLGELGTEL